jgi:hypothetical protein
MSGKWGSVKGLMERKKNWKAKSAAFEQSVHELVSEYSDKSKRLEMLCALGEEVDETEVEQTRQAHIN